MMTIEHRPDRAANFLKTIVNEWCVDGFTFFEHVGEMPSMFDVLYAIEILENAAPKTITIVDDTVVEDINNENQS